MSEPAAPWYVEFFGDDYLRVYADRLTDEHTEAEVAFVERALGLRAGDAVLDLCCGQGRHAILLAKHGIRATGQDLSERYIADARRIAAEQGADAAFVVGDMRRIESAERYDAVINMFTAFGYLEADADNARVLREARRALKPGGRILIDALNREWVLANQTPEERHASARTARPSSSAARSTRRRGATTSRSRSWSRTARAARRAATT